MENPTAVESMQHDEKLSPTLKRCYNMTDKETENEKHSASVRSDGEGEENKTTVPDEIAAKVNELTLSKDDDNNHVECMDTVRKQGETINTLVNQLCVMFQEYEEMNSEREYYEELNEALLRCLEITEGKTEITDESSDEEENDDGDENIRNLEAKTSETKIVITPPEEDDNTVAKMKSKEDDAIETESTEVEMKQESGPSDAVEQGEIPKKKMVKSSELRRLNRILLREIFELRHQMELLKENFRDYLNSEDLSQSEYDTATDDDNASCPACTTHDEDTKDDTEEEYELQDYVAPKIVDESDSD